MCEGDPPPGVAQTDMTQPADPNDLDADLVAALAMALRPAPLSDARRRALRQRVLDATTGASAPAMSVVRAVDGCWLPLLPGVSIKFLRVDPVTRSQSSLWKLEPGSRLPAHSHVAEEECVVLDGSVSYGGSDYGRGDYLLAVPGNDHQPFECAHGATLYIRSALDEHLAALARRAGFAA